ncbi:MAG TPA: DarT ssDNA thymidine ADP-ribosyltransferase family protein [Solirubrobacterales bacterium]|nr:DarT ssDNA thymidine ADP-ribosyltransferase family protein [Solirubrobacterales bacterium]
MKTIAEIIEERKIAEVLHFTTNIGLTGITYKGAILSRKRLPEEKHLEHVFAPNAEVRKDDDWIDHVNLSISRINTEYFDHSTRWHANEDLWWCALAFDPSILSDEDVFFATTNNIYTGCRRESGPAGLEALFAEEVKRWRGHYAKREDGMAEGLTTCHQAEVLYPGALSLDRLIKVYVATGPHADIASSTCDILLAPDETTELASKVPVVVDPNVFKP